MLGEVQSILGHLTSSKMQDLMLIRSSPRYAVGYVCRLTAIKYLIRSGLFHERD